MQVWNRFYNLNICWSLFRKKCWTRNLIRKSLAFKDFGEPSTALYMMEDELKEPKGDEVLIKVLLAPINPSDLNIIEGRYALLPNKLPAIAGNECVGRVMARGEKVRDFIEYEYVVPFVTGLGTWTTHMLVKECQIFSASHSVDLLSAATMTINPCTAYRMLADFTKLVPGDLIIQNGANSAVGQAVHQLCKLWGLRSVGIIRDRPSVAILKQHLQRLGATEVLTEEELEKTEMFDDCLPAPKLALNCVGGKSAEQIAKRLDKYGIMVTYGGMSREPFRVFTGPLIFKQNKFLGFWLTHWCQTNTHNNLQRAMLQEILNYILQGSLVPPVAELIKFDDFQKYKKAFSLNNFTGKKYILDMRVPED